MKKKRLLLHALFIFLVGLALSYFASPTLLENLFATTTMRAQWEKHYDSLGALTHAADAIVAGEVVDLAPGRTVPDDPTVAFTNVRLKVNRAIKGDVGPTIDLEVVGDFRKNRVILLEVPQFEVGRRYLLFLNRQKTAPFMHYVINNQAGYALATDREGLAIVKAADHDDPVASQLDNMRLPVVLDMLRRAARPERPTVQ